MLGISSRQTYVRDMIKIYSLYTIKGVVHSTVPCRCLIIYTITIEETKRPKVKIKKKSSLIE